MWIVEGFNNGDRSDVWYSAAGENWFRLNGTPWPPRHAARLFVHDDSLWIAAGSAMAADSLNSRGLERRGLKSIAKRIPH